jgi:hypothetical protein
MTVLIVRYEVREEAMVEVEAGMAEVMAAVERHRPAGVRYAVGKLADGVTFVGVLELADGVTFVGVLELADGVDNPLPALAAARAFQQDLAGWVASAAPPAPQRLDLVGSYGLVG